MSETIWEQEERERRKEARHLPLKFGLPLCLVLLFLITLSAAQPYVGYSKIVGFEWEYVIKIEDIYGNISELKTSGSDSEPYWSDYELGSGGRIISQTETYYLDTRKGFGAGESMQVAVSGDTWRKAKEGDMYLYCFGFSTVL